MRRVILESPYSGNVAANEAYLRDCIRDCLRRGESPFASHRMFTDALDDNDLEQRAQGIAAGLAWGDVAEATVVYTDRGISPGMAYGIDRAKACGRPIEYRQLA